MSGSRNAVNSGSVCVQQASSREASIFMNSTTERPPSAGSIMGCAAGKSLVQSSTTSRRSSRKSGRVTPLGASHPHPSAHLLEELRVSTQSITATALSEDGSLLVIGDEGGQLRTYATFANPIETLHDHLIGHQVGACVSRNH